MIQIVIEKSPSLGYFTEKRLYKKVLQNEIRCHMNKFYFPSFKEFRKLIWVL